MRGEAVDRVALVTGAGSPSGIGFATARVLGREGATLAIGSTTERIHDRARELEEAGYVAAAFVMIAVYYLVFILGWIRMLGAWRINVP